MSTNPNAIWLLEKNVDKISWYWLLDNPGNVITLFENEDRMDWYLFNLGEKENHNNFFRNTHNNYTPSFRRVSTLFHLFSDPPRIGNHESQKIVGQISRVGN